MQVRPRESSHNHADLVIADAEFSTEVAVRSVASSVPFTNLDHVCAGEFGPRGGFPATDKLRVTTQCLALTDPASEPTFADLVVAIIGVRPKEQVIRPDATPVVAVVADQESVGDRPARKLPSNAMRLESSASALALSDLTITAAISRAGPEPASLGLAHSRPKTSLERHSSHLPDLSRRTVNPEEKS